MVSVQKQQKYLKLFQIEKFGTQAVFTRLLYVVLKAESFSLYLISVCFVFNSLLSIFHQIRLSDVRGCSWQEEPPPIDPVWGPTRPWLAQLQSFSQNVSSLFIHPWIFHHLLCLWHIHTHSESKQLMLSWQHCCLFPSLPPSLALSVFCRISSAETRCQITAAKPTCCAFTAVFLIISALWRSILSVFIAQQIFRYGFCLSAAMSDEALLSARPLAFFVSWFPFFYDSLWVM